MPFQAALEKLQNSVELKEDGPEGPGPAAPYDTGPLAGATWPREIAHGGPLGPDSGAPAFGDAHHQVGLPSTGFLPTGAKRLDQLLGGGFAVKSANLLYGPAFLGKEALMAQAFVSAARHGIPSTFILHTISGKAMSERLRGIDPGLADAERAGLVTYLDLYSPLVGETEPHPNVTYVSDVLDLVGEPSRLDPRTTSCGKGATAFVAFESASTLMVEAGSQATFRVLRKVVGRTVNRGGVVLLSLEEGMHSESDVQMVKHLCSGMLEFRRKGETCNLHVDGLETAYRRPGWIEYEFNRRAFRVTGSFACKTIR